MYLKHIAIRNFRTIRTLDLSLAEGLNIVFGANEIGKSTFLEALAAAFFVNADSTKAEVLKYRSWESQADPFIHVTFVADDKEYDLEKSFIGSKKGRLSCKASGLDTSNKDRITEELGNLIPLYTQNGLSVRNTFWMAQRELEETISSLKDDSDIKASLQRTIFESDGDFEAIKSAVASKIAEIGKGSLHIAKSPGPLAQAKKELDRLTEELSGFRANLFTLGQDIERHKDLTATVASLEKQIKEDDLILRAVEKYRQAKSNFDAARVNFDALQEAIDIYERGETRASELNRTTQELSAQQKAAEEILTAIQRSEQQTQIEMKLRAERDLMNSLSALDNQIAEVKQTLDGTESISQADLDYARDLENAIATKKEALNAAQLSVVAKPLSNVQVSISEDEGIEHAEKLTQGGDRTFKASQRIAIRVPEIMDLAISSGLSGADGLKKDLDAKEISFRSLLAKHGVQTVREIVGKYDAQQQTLAKIGSLETEKKGALRARTVEDVLKSIEGLSVQNQALAPASTSSLKPGESPDTWRRKRDQLTNELAILNAELKQLNVAGKQLQQKFVSVEAAQKRKRELALDVAKAEAVLGTIDKMELPDDQILVRKSRLDTNRIEQDSERSKLLLLSGALQVAPVTSDQVSLKEAELAEAKSRYESELAEFEAYKILAETLAEAEVEVSKHLMRPVEEIARVTLPRLTAGRYSTLTLNETLEVEKLRYGNLDVDPIELSTGAQGQLALVLRLAIIEYLGGKERQMMLIDDAFVNFDQDRLREGKRILSEFAQRHQVIYLSCHPEMREWDGAIIHDL